MQKLSQSRLLPFLYFLSLAGCSSAVAGKAAPPLLPLSSHNILQAISSVACCGVSATESKGQRQEKRETECCHPLLSPWQPQEKSKGMGERRGHGGEKLCLSVQCRSNSYTFLDQDSVSAALSSGRGGEHRDESTKLPHKGLASKEMVRSSDSKLNAKKYNLSQRFSH